MRTFSIPSTVVQHYQPNHLLTTQLHRIKSNFAKLLSTEPEISVVIPAYNEEDNILKTLSSLSASTTKKRLEIIVVNNNSVDRTEELAIATGVTCIRETKQGITQARNAGLAVAKGKYIVNADADTIYPPDWIDEMVQPLYDNSIALTYGKFSFIPIARTTRTTYFFYEYLADFTRTMNTKYKEEAVNVYGFNSAFRREQGLQVDGFNHPPGTNEDGWLALKLRNKGFGKLHCVSRDNALVWTTDRRIQMDGGLWKATVKRLKRIAG